jgi:predicted RNase H-like HicB family nuclease
MKKVYPVIFTQTETTVLVEVPDMGILTEGTDLENAIEMARDAIGLKGIATQDEGGELPEASRLEDIDASKGTFAEDGKNILSLVDIDFTVYRRKMDNKTVRRNVTLPNWLNQEAEAANINVSKVLQDALMQKLNVSR